MVSFQKMIIFCSCGYTIFDWSRPRQSGLSRTLQSIGLLSSGMAAIRLWNSAHTFSAVCTGCAAASAIALFVRRMLPKKVVLAVIKAAPQDAIPQVLKRMLRDLRQDHEIIRAVIIRTPEWIKRFKDTLNGDYGLDVALAVAKAGYFAWLSEEWKNNKQVMLCSIREGKKPRSILNAGETVRKDSEVVTAAFKQAQQEISTRVTTVGILERAQEIGRIGAMT